MAQLAPRLGRKIVFAASGRGVGGKTPRFVDERGNLGRREHRPAHHGDQVNAHRQTRMGMGQTHGVLERRTRDHEAATRQYAFGVGAHHRFVHRF